MKKIFLFVLLTSSVLAGGCLKDKHLNDYSGIEATITIPNSNWPAANRPIIDSIYSSNASSAEIKLYARVSWNQELDTPLQITFQKDDGLVTSYNSKWFRKYEVLPANCYTINSLTLTVPAGSQQAYIPISVFPNKMMISRKYMLGFTLSDAKGYPIASNFKAMLFGISAN